MLERVYQAVFCYRSLLCVVCSQSGYHLAKLFLNPRQVIVTDGKADVVLTLHISLKNSLCLIFCFGFINFDAFHVACYSAYFLLQQQGVCHR